MTFIRPQRLVFSALVMLMAIALAPRAAFAHMGVSPIRDMLHGFAHPLTGLDHIVAIFAIGLWAAQRGGRALWLLPLTFAASMAIGVAIGFAGLPLPYTEPAIIVSVITLGILIATAVRLPDALCAAILCVFALYHGHVHGTEIPASAYGLSYAIGFLPATAVLLVAGVSVGRLAERVHAAQIVRYAGVAIALTGICLS